MYRIRMSLITAFALITYVCVLAAAGGAIRRWLMSSSPAEGPSAGIGEWMFLGVRVFVGGGALLLGLAVGSYFVNRLACVHGSRSWPRVSAVVLARPQKRPVLQRREEGGIQVFLVRFAFCVDGHEYSSWMWTTREYRTGERCPIAYEPTNPTNCCFDPGGDSVGAAAMIVVMMFFGSIGAAVLFLFK